MNGILLEPLLQVQEAVPPIATATAPIRHKTTVQAVRLDVARNAHNNAAQTVQPVARLTAPVVVPTAAIRFAVVHVIIHAVERAAMFLLAIVALQGHALGLVPTTVTAHVL